MINRVNTIATIILIFLSQVLWAQERVKIDSPLTFSEAVKLALEKNIALKQQQNRLVDASMNKTAAFLQMGPSVSVTGNMGRNDGNSFNQNEGKVVNGTLDFTSATLQASMPLFQGFSQMNTYKASRHRLEASVETTKRTREDIIQLVTSQYLQCLLDVELVKIEEGNVKTQQKQLEQIRIQVEAGSRAEVDAANQEFQLKNAELSLLRAENTLRNDKAILANTLRIDPSVNFDIAEPSLDVDMIQAEVSLDELYAIAAENRADLRSAKHTETASQFAYHARKGDYYPSINAFFNYGSRYNKIHGAVNRQFDQQFFEDNVQRTYGISFFIPILGGFQTRSAVVQSRVDYENAQLDTEGLENTIQSQVLRAYQNLQDAITRYQMAQSQLKAAELSYELGADRYELGVSNLVEYTQANRDYIQAQADYASARYTLMFQEILLDYTTGTLSFEGIE